MNLQYGALAYPNGVLAYPNGALVEAGLSDENERGLGFNAALDDVALVGLDAFMEVLTPDDMSSEEKSKPVLRL